MRYFIILALLLSILFWAGFGRNAQTASIPTNSVTFTDVTTTHLPPVTGRSMDAEPADLDSDGDLDLVVAQEFGANKVLINDGRGVFTDESAERLPQPSHDSEDIGIADFDNDGTLDIIFVSEDDQTNELYLNDGLGFFTDASDRLGVTGTSNAVLAIDINDDSFPDILIGNDGLNVILINDGNGNFTDESATRLPAINAITQDLEVGDIDGDSDLDLLVSNENGNNLLRNEGGGFFTDVTAPQLPSPNSGEESREGDFADIDNDGDLDIFFANVTFLQGSPNRNRLLTNDGTGQYTDVSDQLPPNSLHTVDGDFLDVDYDGYVDLLLANAFGGGFQVWVNEGDNTFSDQTVSFLPPTAVGDGIDVESADFNGDGFPDLYLCNFSTIDRLLFANPPRQFLPLIANE